MRLNQKKIQELKIEYSLKKKRKKLMRETKEKPSGRKSIDKRLKRTKEYGKRK